VLYSATNSVPPLGRGKKLMPLCQKCFTAYIYNTMFSLRVSGAGDEIRTHDPNLGKVTVNVNPYNAMYHYILFLLIFWEHELSILLENYTQLQSKVAPKWHQGPVSGFSRRDGKEADHHYIGQEHLACGD
jgi:hypothetical protein